MIDLLLRSDPSRSRTVNERAQADQVYKMGTSLRASFPDSHYSEQSDSHMPRSYPRLDLSLQSPTSNRPTTTLHVHALHVSLGTPMGGAARSQSRTPPLTPRMHSTWTMARHLATPSVVIVTSCTISKPRHRPNVTSARSPSAALVYKVVAARSACFHSSRTGWPNCLTSFLAVQSTTPSMGIL